MSPDEAAAGTPSAWSHPVLGRLLDRLRSAPPRRLPPLPPAGSAPAEHRKFWAELAAHLRPELIAAAPLAVGAMDGLPAAARHAANISLLGPATAHWSRVKAELQVRVDAARVPALSRDRVRLW